MATKPATPPGKNGYQHRQQYGVVVICTDEKHQQRCVASMNAAADRKGVERTGKAGYGGHFRAVQGFRYLGDPACA